MKLRAGLALAAALVGASACGPPPECGGGGAETCLLPQLYVDACATPEKFIAGKRIGGVRECLLDFGVVAAPTTRTVRLTNPSVLDATVTVSLGGPSDGASVVFTLVGAAPRTVGQGLSAEVVVEATPHGSRSATSVLHIATDAGNLPRASGGTEGVIGIVLTASAP